MTIRDQDTYLFSPVCCLWQETVGNSSGTSIQAKTVFIPSSSPLSKAIGMINHSL